MGRAGASEKGGRGGEGAGSGSRGGARGWNDSGSVVYSALGQVEEEATYELPKEWKALVSTLCLRTNFEPAELADLFQRFRSLAGEIIPSPLAKTATVFFLFFCGNFIICYCDLYPQRGMGV